MPSIFDMERICRHCSAPFEVTQDDLKFLEEISPVFNGKKELIPPPTFCPDCRLQRRQTHVNHVNLYERKCDLTGAQIISNIHPSSPYKVFAQEDWYSDKWDPHDYQREFDFSRPFFGQWQELFDIVPRPNLMTGYEFDENCDYTNYAGKNKDCYLIFDSDENRDCYYSYSCNQCMNCVGCFRARKSELCYECIDCVKCYGSSYLQDCDNCSESMFLKNCTGCKKCLMCSNLKNKEYYVENKKITKEEFEKFRAMLGNHSVVESARDRFEKLKLEFPQKFMHGVQNEDVVGDYLVNCKNAYYCFDSEDLWDCRYVFQGFMPLKNCMDIHECGEAERLYECSVAGYELHSCYFCNHTLASMSDMIYCQLCHHSKHCFACVGLRRKEYCILNKQYTKEEYETLVPKIIAHMRSTGEWGEFFPPKFSPFAFNETMAQDFFPLSEGEVLKRGWQWRNDNEKQSYMGPPVTVPDSIDETDDAICEQILRCSVTGKPYKIVPKELAFYRQMGIPPPKKCFEQRMLERMALRNPRKLWNRKCTKCKKEIETTYAPERPEIVYCEECYLASVY